MASPGYHGRSLRGEYLVRPRSRPRAAAADENYPSHPVTLREDNDKISADFPGVLYGELGRTLHCPIMYLQACCGDVIPKIVKVVPAAELTAEQKKMARAAPVKRRAFAMPEKCPECGTVVQK